MTIVSPKCHFGNILRLNSQLMVSNLISIFEKTLIPCNWLILYSDLIEFSDFEMSHGPGSNSISKWISLLGGKSRISLRKTSRKSLTIEISLIFIFFLLSSVAQHRYASHLCLSNFLAATKDITGQFFATISSPKIHFSSFFSFQECSLLLEI